MTDIVDLLQMVKDTHNPTKQGNPYERCEECGFTRHPCIIYEACDDAKAEIERLRAEAKVRARSPGDQATMDRMSDEIERLRAVLTELVDADDELWTDYLHDEMNDARLAIGRPVRTIKERYD